MHTPDEIETLARELAGSALRQQDWRLQIDPLCAALAQAAPQIKPARDRKAVLARAAFILRHMATTDFATLGRLYFDLLPPDNNHPLTSAVLAALSDRRAVLDMLRAAGMEPRLMKDEDGTTFLVIDGLEQADGLSPVMKDAIRAAMTVDAPCPHGGLHALH